MLLIKLKRLFVKIEKIIFSVTKSEKIKRLIQFNVSELGFFAIWFASLTRNFIFVLYRSLSSRSLSSVWFFLVGQFFFCCWSSVYFTTCGILLRGCRSRPVRSAHIGFQNRSYCIRDVSILGLHHYIRWPMLPLSSTASSS